MNEVQQIQNYCWEKELSNPETEMVFLLADLCRKFPQNPDTKKLMAQVAVIRLDGIRQSISIIDKILQESEVSDGHELLYMMGKALGIKLTAEGLRLGRLWGDVIVRDDDPDDPKSVMFGFVGYKLGDTIYLETDEKIGEDQIDDYHARKTFRNRNGGPEKSPEEKGPTVLTYSITDPEGKTISEGSDIFLMWRGVIKALNAEGSSIDVSVIGSATLKALGYTEHIHRQAPKSPEGSD